MTPKTAQKSGLPTPTIAVFDMGGVLLDWNPRHLYRKLIPDAEDMEHFLATVTTTQWHGLQDQGGNPAPDGRPPGQAGADRSLLRQVRRDARPPFPADGGSGRASAQGGNAALS